MVTIANNLTDTNPDIKFVTPDPKLDQMYAFSKQILESVSNQMGLSYEATKKTQTFNSGYQLELSMQSVINANKMERIYYRQPIIDLIKLTLQT